MKENAKQSLVFTREIFSAISFIEVRLYISKKKKMLPEKKSYLFFVMEFQLTVIYRTNSNIHTKMIAKKQICKHTSKK